MYRTSVLREIKGFDKYNITEDLEIAYRIHKHGYKIENCAEAKVYTVLPPTFKQIYVQRRRWYSGAIQTLAKHKDMMFHKKYGFFGILVPYNYLLTFTGLGVFFMSTYLLFKNIFNNLWSMQYTGINIIQRLKDFNFDILAVGNISFIGTSSLVIGLLLLVIGLKFARKKLRVRKLSIIAFPLMFFYYQIWWIGSIIKVVRGKKIKWR
jgi:cellulose synthase/poly-beta-1,6-N-acetylglucosamine synthase-like glycosyltransferase